MVPGVLRLPPKKSDKKKVQKIWNTEMQFIFMLLCFLDCSKTHFLLLYNKINNVLPTFNGIKFSFLKKVTLWPACHMGERPQLRQCAESSLPSPPGDRHAPPPRPLLSGILHLRTFHQTDKWDCRVCISAPRHPLEEAVLSRTFMSDALPLSARIFLGSSLSI